MSNLTKAHDGFGPVSSSQKSAGAFTTGGNPGGYTLSYVSVHIHSVETSTDMEPPKDLAVSIHSPDNPGALLPNPGARLATLSGTSPTGAATVTYACTANCGLARGARYFVRLAADGSPDGSRYNWSHTASFAEDLLPANNGWSLANIRQQFDNSTWITYANSHKFKVAATLNPHLSATGIGATSATLNVNDYTGAAWWRKRTLPSGDDTCRSVNEGTTTASLNDLTEYESYTYTAYDKPGCDSADAIGSVRFTPTDDQLEAGKITDTTATLTLSGHTGNWWLKKTLPVDANAICKAKQTTLTEDLTTLTSGVEYTYTAYDDSTCGGADAIASATFTTFSPALTVSNRGETASGSHFRVGWHSFFKQMRHAMSFETGAKPGGYTLKSVTVRLGAPTGTAPPALYARIFTITPQSVALVANLGSRSASGAGDVTWTCAGSGCGLDGNTTYFLVLDTGTFTSSTTRVFNWSYTDSDDETNTPATAGWEIGDSAVRRYGTGSWLPTDNLGAGAFSITADVNPALTVSELKSTTATLNVADRPGTAWWYKRSAGTPADTTCHRVAAGTFKDSLTGLAEYVTYTYTVYDKANCNSADAIAAFTFTTPGDALAVGNLLDDSATLTLTDRAGVWWLKRTTPADATCKSKGTTATESLTGLHPGATYVYKAYSDAACATEIARETFTTLELAAADLADTSATLTLTGHTGNWYYQSSKTPDNSCKGLVATSSQDVSGLTADTGYVYKAHTGRACTSAQRLATLAFRTAVSAGNLAESYTGFVPFGNGGVKLAGRFTTGSDAGGYTLASVTVNIHAVTGSPGAPTVSIYSTASNGEPGTSVTTLSGSAPTSAGNHTFTCSANCALAADTDYYVHLAADSATAGNFYSVSLTESYDQDLAPSGNGWALANGYRHYQSNSWIEYSEVLRFKVTAVANPTLSASGVTEDAAALTIVKYTGGAWWHKRTAPSGDTTCHAVAEGTATASLNGLTSHASHTYRAYDRPGCASADEIDAVTFVATDDVLTAGKLTRTTATLTLTGHTGGWWYKRTAGTPADSTCTSVAAGTKPANLTNLTAGVTYTYKVYDTNGCADADEIASETFTTLARVTVSNLAETAGSDMRVGDTGFAGTFKWATGFETGDNELGYTLESVTVSLGTTRGSPTGLTARIHNASTDNSDLPGTVFKNLGSQSPAGAGNATWTCSDSGTGCDLKKETTYHLVMEATTTGERQYYRWNDTSSDNETNTPTGAGWEISDGSSRTVSDGNSWVTGGSSPGQFSVTASAIGDPFLDARNVTESGAALAMVSYRGAWWYERTAGTPADATCRSVANATTTVTLSGLTMGETYTYKAYDKTGCNSADEIGSDTFTTDGVSVSNLGETLFNSSCVAGRVSGVHTECAQSFTTGSAAGGYTLRRANVRIRSIVNSPGNIRVTLHADSSGSPASAALATLSGANPATANSNYGFTCSACYLDASTTYWIVVATPNATQPFQSYTLPQTNSDAQKQGPSGNGWSIGDVGKFRVTAGANSSCPSGWCADTSGRTSVFAVEAALTPPFSAGSITATTATLTLTGHSGGWWYKRTAGTPADATCRSVAAGTTSADLIGLTQNSSYTYKAYAKANCNSADEIAVETFSTLAAGGSQGNRAAGGGTVVIAGNPDARPHSSRGQALRGGDGIGGGEPPGRSAGDAADTALPTGYVTNLASARSGDSDVDATQRQAVAFTTGPNPGGYVLKTFTAALRKVGVAADLVLTLHVAAGTYGPDSQPSETVRSTLAGSAPVSGAYADVTYTCAGSGCRLDPDTTYFVVASVTGAGAYAWAYAAASHLYRETTEPADSGWDIETGHVSQDGGDWQGWDDWHHARLDFAALPSHAVTVDNLARPVHDDACFPSGDTRCAVAFTTGPAPEGYTLDAITARFDGRRRPGRPAGRRCGDAARR